MRLSDELPLVGAVLEVWRQIKQLRGAARVRSRDELDAALARAPRYIVVEGTEALRAYAASLAYRGGQEAARLEEAAQSRAPTATPDYMVVPTVGRIRDGYRQRSVDAPRSPSGDRSRRRRRLRSGMSTVIAAGVGLFAALLIEFLAWPAGDPELVRGPHKVVAVPPRHGVEQVRLPTHAPPPPPPSLGTQIVHVVTPILVVVATIGLGLMLWQAIGPNRPVRVSWRVDYRIQGRLVMARVRTRIA